MAAFRFRLQRLLDLRREAEEAAKTSYLEAVARRLEAETGIEQVKSVRLATLANPGQGLQHRVAAQRYAERLDDEQRAQEALVALLAGEEETARAAWRLAHQEVETFEKLRERDYAEWRDAESKREQAELDEWATMRRKQ